MINYESKLHGKVTMNIDKLNINEVNKTSQQQNKIDQPTNDQDFCDVLKRYISENKNYTENNTEPHNINKIIKDKLLDSNYNSFNEVKIGKSSLKDISRDAKIELAKKRLSEGFYLRNEILSETAGQIIDSIGS